MAVTLTSNPYYDDFDADKNFYRILFKPGVAVQARELTQIQSILQDQITKFANHIFKDGSRISKYDPSSVDINSTDYKSIKLSSTVNAANLSSYIGTYVTGETSNIIGMVAFAFDANDPNINDPATLVVKILKSTATTEFNDGEILKFYSSNIEAAYNKTAAYVNTETVGTTYISGFIGNTEELSDTITFNSSVTYLLNTGDQLDGLSGSENNIFVVEILNSTQVLVNKNVGVSATNESLIFKRKSTSPTLVVTISNGTFYKNGLFIGTTTQSVVPQKYTAYPTKSIGYRYLESITSYSTDETLLDPAFGSSNYLAPGADRLKIELEISSIELTSDGKPNITDKYIEIVRFINGRYDLIEGAADTIYAALGDTLAERTYIESGNYGIDSFRLTSGGSTATGDKNRFFISKGRAYVGGYDILTSGRQELLVPKASNNEAIPEFDVSTYYGNYILIDKPMYGLYDPQNFNLRYYWECHSTANRSAMAANTTLVGYITPKLIKFDNGSGSNVVHRFYWYTYEQANASLSFNSIRSIIGVSNYASNVYGDNYSTYTTPSFFANIAASGITTTEGLGANIVNVFESSSPSRLIFPTGKSVVKSIENVNVIYSKLYANLRIYSGQAIVTVSSPERFVGTVGVLSNSYSKPYYTVAIKQKIDSLTIPGYVTGAYIPAENLILSLDADKQALTVNFGNTSIEATIDLLVTLENNELEKRTKTLVTNYGNVVNITNSEWNTIYKSDIYALKGIYKLGSNTYAGVYNSATPYSANTVINANGSIYLAKVTNTGTSLSNTTTWKSIQGDSLLLYTLDNGQADSWYGYGSVKYLGSDAYYPGNALVVFDYFTHSGKGVIDVTSYDSNLYSSIPEYKSKTDSKVFQLRDCLDFRPRKQDNETSKVILAESVKPDPVAVPGTQVDISYYLPRIDRLYIQTKDVNTRDPGNKFRLDLGVSAVIPTIDADISDRTQQLIATIVSPAYTASASEVKITYNDSARYTMKDIGSIDKRLNSLEKRVKKQGLDLIALNNKVYDRAGPTTGNVLYNTGIFVEDFSSIATSKIENPFFTVGINVVSKECRAAFSSASHKLFFATDPDVSYYNDLISMNFTEESFISQTAVNGIQNANPGGSSGGWSSLLLIATAAAVGYELYTSLTAAAVAVSSAAAEVVAVELIAGFEVGGSLVAADVAAAAILSDTAVGEAVVIAVEAAGIVETIFGFVTSVVELFAWFSDSRLKENIQLVDTIDNINVYTYNYIWDKTEQRGVLAEELLNSKYSHAVTLNKSGFYQVDYSKLPTLH